MEKALDTREVNIKDIVVLDDKENRANSEDSIIESISREGILVPLSVYEEDGKYVLIAGHRRLASAKHFGLDTVPVCLFPKDKTQTVRALENIDRKPLHPLDEADQIRALLDDGYSRAEISSVLGISRDRVVKRSRLSNLIPKYREALKKGDLMLSAAEQLAIISPKEQEDIKAAKWMGANDIVNAYINKQEISLNSADNEFLRLEPDCSKCPNNVISEDAELFPGTCGACKDSGCYITKLKAYLEKTGAAGFFDAKYDSSDSFKSLFSKNGIKPLDIPYYRVRDDISADYKKKVLSFQGHICYAYEPSEKTEVIEPANTKFETLSTELYKQHEAVIKLCRAYLKEIASNYARKISADLEKPYKKDNPAVVLAQSNLRYFDYEIKEWFEEKNSSTLISSLSNVSCIAYAMVGTFLEDTSENELDNSSEWILYSKYWSIDKSSDYIKKIEMPKLFEIETYLGVKAPKNRLKIEKAVRSLDEIYQELIIEILKKKEETSSEA